MRFRLQTKGFSAGNGKTDVEATALDIAWAAARCGRFSWSDPTLDDDARFLETLGVLFQVRALLRDGRKGVEASDIYRALEPSEKAVASFRIAMGLTLLAAERHVGVVELHHLRRLIGRGHAVLHGKSKCAPDFAGEDAGGAWHAVETKGRSSYPSADVRKKAKAQAVNLALVNGALPNTKSAALATLGIKPLKLELLDPPREPPRARRVEVRIDREAALADYYWLPNYLAASRWEQGTEHVGGIAYRVWRTPWASFGFPEDAFEMRGSSVAVAQAVRRKPETRGEPLVRHEHPDLSVGRDRLLLFRGEPYSPDFD